MSFGQSFDEAEMDRHLQEVRRRQQQLAAGNSAMFARQPPRPGEYMGAAGAPGAGGANGGANMLNHHDPYFRQAYAPRSAYPNMNGPPPPNSYPPNGPPDNGSLARLYAEQQRREQVAQANYAAAYGGQPNMNDQRYSYGMPPTPSSGHYAPHHPSPREHYQPHSMQSQQQQPPMGGSPSAPTSQGYSPAWNPAVTSPHNGSTVAGNASPSLLSPHQSASSAMDGAEMDESTSPPSGAKKSANKPGPKGGKKDTTPGSAKAKGSKKGESADSPVKPPPKTRIEGSTVTDDEGNTYWYTGCVPLGLEDDKYWLSELQVYLRANFAEAFGATEDDIAAPMHGRNKPIALGQVGIRCMHCKNDNPAERGQQATSYPSMISGIYNSVQQMLRLHLDCCLSMPAEIRAKVEQLKLSCSSRGGRKQYWVDSAKRLGLVDTSHGIHFCRDPSGPLPPLSGPSVNSKEGRKKKLRANAKNPQLKDEPEEGAQELSMAESFAHDESKASPLKEFTIEDDIPMLPVDSRPLVFPEDKPLISDYLYLTLEQMAPCQLMEADRVGCYKTRKVGFPGLACKHCVGQAGCGRYFPASEASLSQTTTSQTIMNHVRNCRRCPIEIRENLEVMKRNRVGSGYGSKRANNKPKHGGRKVFFHRLWCRIQGIPFEEGKGETKESKKKPLKRTASLTRRKKKKRKKADEDSEGDDTDDDSQNDDDEDNDNGDAPAGMSSDDEDDSDSDADEDEESAAGSGENDEGTSKPKEGDESKSDGNATKRDSTQIYEGCVRLTKTDDPHWLSEMECFARTELVELFSLKKKDILEGYGGRKAPSVGQVGIRCVYCKSLEPAERPSGYMVFPDSLSSLHSRVSDMIRLHFTSCPALPAEQRDTFKSLRGFDAKVTSDDSQQYWVDAARDIGLSNIPPSGTPDVAGWGITFRRDPLQPSPADELDLEGENGDKISWGKNSLVLPADRDLCTDQVILLLRQIAPCRFKKSDRRAGPGSRGRDRVMGFPGISCVHCANKNTLGRYFPVSSKNLTDNTAASIQAHVASCTRCPELIKASLAYLSHRSIMQKAELSGSWKRSFFKKVWDRLHVERKWSSIDDEEADIKEEGETAEVDHGGAAGANNIDEEDANIDNEGSDSENEDLGDQMNALIKAAALWLTETDQTNDSSRAAARAVKKNLPAKHNTSYTVNSRTRAANLPTTKRRRVHF